MKYYSGEGRRWADHVARMGENSGANKVLGQQTRQKTHPARPRCRWEGNIKVNLQNMNWGGCWVELAQDKDRLRGLVNAVLNLCIT
jgi:hypothetical protein